MLKVGDGEPADGDASTLTGALISTEAPTALTFLKQPQSLDLEQNRPATFSVNVVTPPGNPVQDPLSLLPDVTYQWRRNGSDIPIADENSDGIPDVGSAGTATYVIPFVSTTDNGAKFTCRVTPSSGAAATSEEALLTVTADTTAPVIANVLSSSDFKHLTVTYSEAMDTAAGTVGNYSISGGVTVTAATVVSPTVVVLTTSAQAGDTSFVLTVNNVKDLAGNGITEKTAAFRSFVSLPGTIVYKRWDDTRGTQQFLDEGGQIGRASCRERV